MMNYSSEGLGVMLPVSVDSTGRMLTRRKNCSGSDILPEERKYSQTYIYRVSRRSLPVIYFHLRNLQARYGTINFMV